MSGRDAKNPANPIVSHGESSRLSDEVDIANSSPSLSVRPQLPRTVSRISTNAPTVYKVYKRRFFGLIQLILLNIVVSWGWTAFAPISDTAAEYFHTSETAINWLAIAYFFAFVAAAPIVFWTLNKRGPKTAIVISASLLFIGNWIKYAGARTNNYGVVMFGQILIGFSQPFVLTAPSTYSNIWFSTQGRTSATAVASLANPLGAALGQLISPFWTTSAEEVPSGVLYVSIIATVACLPALFIPAKPPTPPSAAVQSNGVGNLPLRTEVKKLFQSVEFYLLWIPFSVYVGFFNAFSSLTNQLLEPYDFSQDDAGIAGAVLILVGLASAAVSSPLIDKYKFYLWYIRAAVPIVAIVYFIMIWAPSSRSLPFIYVVCAVEGAASFGLVPVVLEYLVEIEYPLGPETGSVLCWAGGQLLGGIFTIIMDALLGTGRTSRDGVQSALIFQGVVSILIMPMALLLGFFGRSEYVRMRRWEVEQRQRGNVDLDNEDDEEAGVLGRDGNGELRI